MSITAIRENLTPEQAQRLEDGEAEVSFETFESKLWLCVDGKPVYTRDCHPELDTYSHLAELLIEYLNSY